MQMKMISTHEAARRLGVHFTTLAHYIAVGKLPSPAIVEAGSRTVHAWTEEEVENARKLLPTIANGRKTRYRKKHSVVSTQQSAKTKKRKPQTKKK
jgi:predicted DNA-binding transcriptional regulator AlpA